MTTRYQNQLFTGTGTGPTDPLFTYTDQGSTARVQVELTSTGTIAWEHTVDGTNWRAIAAYSESGQTLATTATTSDIYTINTSGSHAVRANISANGAGMVITGIIVKGGGGGASGGGSSGGGTPSTYVPVLRYGDTALTQLAPAGDTQAHSAWVIPTGPVADGNTAAGVPAIIIGGTDNGGLARTAPVNLASTTPVSTSTYGVSTNANLFGLSSANTLRALVTATGFSAGGTGATTLMVAEARASNVTAGTYEQVFNNINVSVLTSAARTTTQTSADQTNFNHRGIKITLDVTSAGTGSVTLALNGKDLNSGKYSNILTGAAVTTNSTVTYTVFPGATAAANLTVNDIISRLFQIVVTANNANSVTYSVSYSLIV